MSLDLIGTLAVAGLALVLGQVVLRVVPAVDRLNVPAPVLGGLLVAGVVLVSRARGVTLLEFDTTLQRPLMNLFFTTVGFAASLALLRVGGPLVVRFLVLSTGFAVVQNVAGAAVALAFGQPALLGVLAGSVTLTGGPATGLAFAPQFEAAGVAGAASVGVAVAMGGIVSGGLLGGPLVSWLLRRHRVAPAAPGPARDVTTAPQASQALDERGILANLVTAVVAVWLGGWVSQAFESAGITLPGYIGAMLVAAVFRNVDDRTGWLGLSPSFLEQLGAASLSLFLAMAIMTLKLWELATLAIPLVAILAVQVAVVAVFSLGLVFRVMGRDYESAVMTGGFVGFMLGTTANAMAVMRAVALRHGPAPTAFLVAPLVGAFFIDFTNALIITAALNLLAP